MLYDLAVDREVRSQVYQQFVEIKNEIGEDPQNFIPILGDVILTVATGNSSDEWKATVNGVTDTGKRTHLATRGTGNAIITAMTGVAIINNLPDIAEQLTENIRKVRNISQNLGEFVSKSLSEKLEDIKNIWKIKYPVEEMFEGRTFFEDMMGEYRYTKAEGWGHTTDISPNFKGVDFYRDFAEIDGVITAKTAVSMKTTVTIDVNAWLKSEPIQKNIEFLTDGLSNIGLESNGKLMKIMESAEIHIYMPNENIPLLKDNWLKVLNTPKSKIKFEIHALEDFVK
jgi:hypothetical protein